MEELLSRHRKEQRDLQSRVTQKKKQASKKTRKSVNDECENLEKELKRRQDEEIAALNGDGPPTRNDDELTPEQIEALTLQIDEPQPKPHTSTTTSTPQPTDPEAIDSTTGGQPKKPNRAKARLARRAAEQEAIAQQAAAEAQDLPDLKTQERERMLSYMAERNLLEKEIRADGHCLYSAVADQLEQLDVPVPSGGEDKMRNGEGAEPYRRIRAVAADYIERHADDYVPFLEEDLESYLHKVRDTGEWGGQVELMALARSLGVDIHVLQDFGRVEKFEGGKAGGEREMWLGYYKHGFGLGEHYNSLRKKG